MFGPASGLMDVVGRDVRYAFRAMRRTPSFTAVALVTLAIAIGANTAIFSVVDALLVRPLPYRDADRLVTIDATRDYEGASRPIEATFQLDAAQRWQDALHVFDDVGLYADGVLQLTRSEEHTSELQSRLHLVCRLLLEKKKTAT